MIINVEFDSQMLTKAVYDTATEVLTVHFKRGHVYEYTTVPESVIIDMEQAESSGKFFLAHIRDQYLYKKVLGV